MGDCAEVTRVSGPPHGPARIRPADGARPAAFLGAAGRRARRLSAVQGHHRLIRRRRIARSGQGALQPSSPVTQTVALVPVQETTHGAFPAISGYPRRVPWPPLPALRIWLGALSRAATRATVCRGLNRMLSALGS